MNINSNYDWAKVEPGVFQGAGCDAKSGVDHYT